MFYTNQYSDMNIIYYIIDFDFNSIAEKDNEWVTRYERIIRSSLHPLFLLFPFFDSHYLSFLFPGRRQTHRELDLFLDKMQEIITNKRAIILDNNNESVANKKTNEKDLLTLMLEASQEEGGTLSDKELKVNKKKVHNVTFQYLYIQREQVYLSVDYVCVIMYYVF